jgi:hypothetical protein
VLHSLLLRAAMTALLDRGRAPGQMLLEGVAAAMRDGGNTWRDAIW